MVHSAATNLATLSHLLTNYQLKPTQLSPLRLLAWNKWRTVRLTDAVVYLHAATRQRKSVIINALRQHYVVNASQYCWSKATPRLSTDTKAVVTRTSTSAVQAKTVGPIAFSRIFHH